VSEPTVQGPEQGRLAGGEPARWRLGFAYLGGALAWAFHILAIWALAEGRCIDPAPEPRALGVAATAWLVLGVSVVAATTALAALRAARRERRALPREADPRAHLARAGLLMNAVFLWIIALQTVPVFFFLARC
jgi:hypothetical protein